jgi:UTP--glucose-1-phosphate uridylyltransferase
MANAKVTKAIFPVAGLGTRFLPATKAIPKETLTLVDRPLIQYAVDEALASGIEQLIFVTSRGKSNLEDYFDRSPELERTLSKAGKKDLLRIVHDVTLDSGAVTYVRQNQALGLGHAISCARHLIQDEPFAVILPDDVISASTPCLKQMIDVYNRTGGSVISAMEVPPALASSYGILDVAGVAGRVAEVRGIVEKPAADKAPSNLAVIGRYILDPSIFDHLDGLPPSTGGEIQLTDGIAAMIAAGQGVHAYRFSGDRFDCGSKAGFLQATVSFALARSELREEFGSYLNSMVALQNAAQ